MKTFSSLHYCSQQDDKQCNKGVARFEYRVRGRDPHFAEIYDYPAPNRVNVKLSEILIKLNDNAQESLGEDNEYYLHSDSNNNGTFDSSDKRLAQGLLRRKQLLFEKLNHVPVNTTPRGEAFDRVFRFFIVNENSEPFGFTQLENEEGELETLPIIKEIEVTAHNLASNNDTIVDLSSFADLSLFRYGDMVGQSKESFLSANPEFSMLPSGRIALKKGSYSIERDVIIPENLQVEVQAGAEVRIATGKSVVSYPSH